MNKKIGIIGGGITGLIVGIFLAKEGHKVSIFEKNRITKLDTNNKKFDPNFHQAMSEIEDDSKDSGSILNEIQAGYMLGDRLLRPALVSVSKKKVSKDKENGAKK